MFIAGALERVQIGPERVKIGPDHVQLRLGRDDGRVQNAMAGA